MEDYAIVIGIDGYSQLLPLTSARSDAAAFIKWLLEPPPVGGGLKEENVRPILSTDDDLDDPEDAEPVQKHINKALRDFGVRKNQRIGRRLYFYFAGHGFGPKFDEVGMVMANAAMDGLPGHNIGLHKYNSFFRDHHLFDEVVFILDCCRDPGYSSVETDGPGFNLDPPPDNVPPTVHDYIMLAAKYGEKAFAPPATPPSPGSQVKEPRGLLTKALLEALRGETRAVDGLGRVTSASLTNYVQERVVELATDEKLRQSPEVPRLPNPEMVFAVHAKQILVRIIAPGTMKGKLIVRDSFNGVVAEQQAELATEGQPPWEVSLLDVGSNYTVELEGTNYDIVLKIDKVKGNGNVFRLP
jgi:hypothetical protein